MIKKISTHILVAVLLLLPVVASAALFDPNKGLIGGICDEGADLEKCNFASILKLVNSIISFIFYVSIPLATILFAYAGFLILTAGPNASQAEKGKAVFTNVAIGFGIILAAWLIVYTITSALIKENFFDPAFTPLKKP